MNISRISFLSLKLAALALTGAAALAGCATSSPSPQKTVSSLPVETRSTAPGSVISSRAYQSGGKLYVSGSARKHPLSSGGHVDVQLIGADGEVIAEKQDDINPQHPRSGGGRRHSSAYVASFPLSVAGDAAKIRVIFHDGSHS